ncbi:hypothetical protein D9C73_027753 [Collichthys lucidus]|uniref:Uncharacterized protein n=1 Tax=Collichthys lucidus TaxID=240159 RepID=A0A4U5TW23_COLLU|nr:hypothetical protein D9C73_027753 [Collichthys lucidus]
MVKRTTKSVVQAPQVCIRPEVANPVELDLPDDGKFQRMPCLAYTLQLSLKDAMRHPSTDLLLTRARKLNMMEAQYNQCNPPTTPQDVRNEAETPSANAVFQKYRFLATRMEVNVLFQNGPEISDGRTTEFLSASVCVDGGVVRQLQERGVGRAQESSASVLDEEKKGRRDKHAADGSEDACERLQRDPVRY